MREDPRDHGRLLDGGDDLESLAAALAVFDIDVEDAPLPNDRIGSVAAVHQRPQ